MAFDKFLKFSFILLSFLMICAPLIQMGFHVAPNLPLAGADVVAEKPGLNWRDWISGAFQSKFERYLGQNFGLRSYFIKTNNQLSYWIFRECGPCQDPTIIGEQGVLNSLAYVKDYLESRHSEQMASAVSTLSEIQHKLDKRGVAFFVLITPNKASVYPEYIPRGLKRGYSFNQRYEQFASLLRKSGVDFVDGHSILIEKKEKLGYPLFNRGGLHWNELGAYYVLDSLLTKIEALTRKCLTRPKLKAIDIDPLPLGADCDLAILLNLWRTPLNGGFIHLRFSESQHSSFKPSILVEGGSFNYLLLTLANKFEIAGKLDFYYYYHDIYQYERQKEPVPSPIESLNWETDVFGRDVIILELNETFITDDIRSMGSGFVMDLITKMDDSEAPTKH